MARTASVGGDVRAGKRRSPIATENGGDGPAISGKTTAKERREEGGERELSEGSDGTENGWPIGVFWEFYGAQSATARYITSIRFSIPYTIIFIYSCIISKIKIHSTDWK